MASFSVNGLSSGIDYGQLVEQLVSLKRRGIDLLKSQKSNYQSTLSSYNSLASKLETMESAASKLKDASSFDLKLADVSDSTVLSASASTTAITGNYTISDVTALAQAHKITHNTGWADKDTTAVSSAAGSFKWKVGSSGTVYSVSVTTATTLEQLASAINSANGGIKATIINDGGANPYRLVLTSNTSGASSNIIITQDDTNLDTALNAFSTTLQSAQDASFKVDGLSITKSSNTVTDAIPGVTFTLKKAAGVGNSSTITVKNDTDTIKSNIKAMIDAYNAVVNQINAESTYNTESKKGGPLFNEGTTGSVMRRLQSIITGAISGLAADTKVLAQVGVKTNKDGTITLDEAKLADKLTSDFSDTRAFFINNTVTGIAGVAKKLYDELDDITDFAEGVITVRKEGIQKIIDRYTAAITKDEADIERYEESLRVKFGALESLLSALKTQSSYIATRLK